MTLLIVCIEEIYCPNKKNTIKKKRSFTGTENYFFI